MWCCNGEYKTYICQKPIKTLHKEWIEWMYVNLKNALRGKRNPGKNADLTEESNCITNTLNNFTEGNGRKMVSKYL